MDVESIRDHVRQLRICEDEDGLVFKAAVLLLYGISVDTCSISKLKRGTGYWWREVHFIVHNFWANGVIFEYHWNLEQCETDLEALVEIVLCSMAGAGEIIRRSEGINPSEKSLKWEEYIQKTGQAHGVYIATHLLRSPLRRGIKKKIVDDTPQWLLDKQKRIKEIASKIDNS